MDTVFRNCGVSGSVTVYDFKNDEWKSSDFDDAEKRTLPASTFKIPHTLIAFEVGIIDNIHQTLAWPGKPDEANYGYRPDIYHKMDIQEAYDNSAVWFYLELAKNISKTNYRNYLETLNYGNENLSNTGLDFWNFGSLGISPKEQIQLLKGIYEQSFPFSQKSYLLLKQVMLDKTKSGYRLYSKTGWTSQNGMSIGWWVGFIVAPDNTYFFASRIRKNKEEENDQFADCRKTITLDMLKLWGIPL